MRKPVKEIENVLQNHVESITARYGQTVSTIGESYERSG